MDSTGAPDLESQEIHAQNSSRNDRPRADSNGDDLARNGEHPEEVFLAWKDLTLKVPPGRTILNHLSGFVLPSHLLAIMGPSGSGKSSLLTTVAGRPPNNATVTGDISLNGERANLSYGTVAAFLDQEVTLLGTLTVYETLYYSAKLRFPDSVNEKEAQRIVAEAIRQVGLQAATNTRIGTWYQRGISGGEKRRVSIAIELLTSPYLMFLDEPTSGLDSAASFHVIKTLKDLAEDGSRTILCSIHQPSSEVFELFDDLCLLSDGQQIYFGPLDHSTQFFERNGLPCPPMRNPADHYLHCVNADFDKVEQTLQESYSRNEQSNIVELNTSPLQKSASNRQAKLTVKQIVILLSEAYSSSGEKQVVDDQVSRISKMKGSKFQGRGHAGFVRQCVYLTMRSFVNMNRDLGYYWLRLLMFTIIIVGIGTVYYNIDHSFLSIQARVTVLFFFAGFLSFMAVGGFPSHIEVLKVYNTERINGHYGAGPFVVGSTLSPLPFLAIISAASLISYPMIKFQSGVVRVIFFALNLFACLTVAEFLMMAIAVMISNYLVCIIFGAGAQALFILSCGFFRMPDYLPNVFWKYPLYYIDYIGMAFQGYLQNEFIGSIFEGPTPSSARLSGHYLIYDVLEVENRSKWINFALQWAVALGFRILFFLLLKSKETSYPSYPTINGSIFRRNSAFAIKQNSKNVVNDSNGLPNNDDGVAE